MPTPDPSTPDPSSPDEAALTLARLRAARTAVVPPEADGAVRRRAERLGRVPVDLSDGRAALAWRDGAAPELDETWSAHRLPPVAVRTLAACLGLCWPDPVSEPYPGVPTSIDAVRAALAAKGTDTRHGQGALTGELATAGLVAVEGETVRLGPAVATWSPGHVAALRRSHDRLPRATTGEQDSPAEPRGASA